MGEPRRVPRALALVWAIGLVGSACAGGGASPSPSTATPAPTAGPTAGPTATPTPAAWTPQFVNGVLQPHPDGFPNGPITLATQAEPGSDDGIYARQFQEAAGDISPVPINVVDRPDFGNQWELLRWVPEQPGGKDGQIMQVATFPGAVFDLLVAPITKDLGLTLDSWDPLMLTEHVPWVMISRADAPWGNDIEAMVAWAKDNPDQLKVLVRGPDSGTTLGWQDFANKMGITRNEVAGGSSSEIATSIGAGAGDVALTTVSVALPVIESGRAVVLGCTGTVDPCAGFDKGRSLSSITGVLDPWGANRAITVPTGIPAEHRAWLEALVREVAKSDKFVASRTAVPGFQATDGDSEDAQAIMKAAYDVAYVILKEKGLLDPSVP